MIGNLLKGFGKGGGTGIAQALAMMSDLEMEDVSLADAPHALRALAMVAARPGAKVTRVRGAVKGDRMEVLMVVAPSVPGTLVTKKPSFALDAAHTPA